jgi:hypothetical protein
VTADDYLRSIIDKYQVNKPAVEARVEFIKPTIKRWAGQYLFEVIYSGSIAKGTAVSLAVDADAFISLTSTTPDSLSDIYNSLYETLLKAGYEARKQDVSVRVHSDGFKIDLVPGKRQSQYGYDHSLYKSKTNTWVKTNVKTHITYVVDSKRLGEIKLTKIWRQLQNLEFPSFYLELAVIDCLAGRSFSDLSGNFLQVLSFLANDFATKRFVDPANTNNVVSDDTSYSEKQLIRVAAQAARARSYWSEIVW